MKVVKPIIDRPTETHYLLIVDSSTSMRHLTSTTINGVNEQIDMIKDLEKEFPEQKYFMSFMHFNSKIVTEYNGKNPSELEHINESNYNCSGMTALMDAIGQGVNSLNDQIGSKIESGEATAVVVIITDGEENSSRTFNLTKVKSLIEELQATNKWTFTFIGANIDSMATARNYGIATNNVVQFSSDVNSNTQMYASISKSFKSRATKLNSMDFSPESFKDLNDFISEEDKDITTKNDTIK
jgi:hypothetical protein